LRGSPCFTVVEAKFTLSILRSRTGCGAELRDVKSNEEKAIYLYLILIAYPHLT
jgi:hypothetical protein